MNPINTVLADAHELFMDGFEKVLTDLSYPRVEVMARANSARLLKQTLYEHRPDILFMELNFTDEDGLSLIPVIKQEWPDLRLCVVSGYTDHKFVKEAFQKGADGYYSKYNNLAEISDCLNDLMVGNTFLATGLEITPSKNGSKSKRTQPFEDRFLLRKKLTRREQEVLELITKALNNKEIASQLYISDQTVGVHRKNIMRKLGVRNTVNLIKFAIDHQLVQ